jgi:hypothetical protein
MLPPQIGFVARVTFFLGTFDVHRRDEAAQTDGTELRTSPPLRMGIANG